MASQSARRPRRTLALVAYHALWSAARSVAIRTMRSITRRLSQSRGDRGAGARHISAYRLRPSLASPSPYGCCSSPGARPARRSTSLWPRIAEKALRFLASPKPARGDEHPRPSHGSSGTRFRAIPHLGRYSDACARVHDFVARFEQDIERVSGASADPSRSRGQVDHPPTCFAKSRNQGVDTRIPRLRLSGRALLTAHRRQSRRVMRSTLCFPSRTPGVALRTIQRYGLHRPTQAARRIRAALVTPTLAIASAGHANAASGHVRTRADLVASSPARPILEFARDGDG